LSVRFNQLATSKFSSTYDRDNVEAN